MIKNVVSLWLSHWWLEVCYGGHADTVEIGRGYKWGFHFSVFQRAPLAAHVALAMKRRHPERAGGDSRRGPWSERGWERSHLCDVTFLHLSYISLGSVFSPWKHQGSPLLLHWGMERSSPSLTPLLKGSKSTTSKSSRLIFLQKGETRKSWEDAFSGDRSTEKHIWAAWWSKVGFLHILW